MKAILKQVAIAMSPDGGIGINDNLLFNGAVDMRNFYQFTYKTAMIVGRITAEQMIQAGVTLDINRPMVVISNEGAVDFRHAKAVQSNKGHVYYARNFSEAKIVAEHLTDRHDLNGWTVIGGASVYKEMLAQIDIGITRINNAYIHVAITSNSVMANRTVGCTVEEFGTFIRNGMIRPAVNGFMTDVTIKDESGDEDRCDKGAFINIYDLEEYDPCDIRMTTASLRIKRASGGKVVFEKSDIVGYEVKSATNVIVIHVRSGIAHEIRMEAGKPALFALETELKKILL